MDSTLHRIQNNAVAQGWCDFIGRWQWDYFTTNTYRTPCFGIEKAQRDLSFWLYQWGAHEAESRGLAKRKKTASALDGSSGGGVVDLVPTASPPPRWTGAYTRVRNVSMANRPVGIMAIEPHKSGAYHAHVLVRSPDWFPLSIKTGHAAWFKRHGGIRIESPNTQKAVSAYCSKYVVKGGEIILSPYLA